MTSTTSQDQDRPAAATSEVPTQRVTSPVVPRPATATPAPPAPTRVGPALPDRGPAVAARPVRVAPARMTSLRSERRRWPAAVGGLAAGLTLGTVGAVGAVFALSAIPTASTTPALAAPAVSETGLSPNVSVPGRVLTAFGDGTWQVGVDIAAGSYRTTGPVGDATCRHALRTARAGGAVTAAEASPGRDAVVLTEADGWFTTAGCATWRRTA